MRKELLTVGEIAKRLNRPRHQITYLIEKLGIEPAQRAGVLRLFADQHVAEIGRELEVRGEAAKIETRREWVNRGDPTGEGWGSGARFPPARPGVPFPFRSMLGRFGWPLCPQNAPESGLNATRDRNSLPRLRLTG